MKEEWKISSSWPRCEVSNLGRIRNTQTKKSYYTRVGKHGYEEVQFKVNGKRKTVKVHRLVAEMFCNKSSENLVVNHVDGDKTNNTSTNLEWVTQLENVRHARDSGLTPSLKGELNGRAVLNEELVHCICKDYQDGLSPSVVIKKYRITRNQAIKIKSRLTWSHITSQYKY